MNKIEIKPSRIPFDLKTREMCKSCKRYGIKTSCPPNVESVEYYKKLFKKYKKGFIYYEQFDRTDDWKKLGKDSSLLIHAKLLEERDRLFNEGHVYINIFGAGSCKMCDECLLPCRLPNKSVIPLEGTGVDVVKLMGMYDVKITFPITDTMYRIGLVLYD